MLPDLELSIERFTGVANPGAASQAPGHSHLSTTTAIYGHYDLTDLERALDALAKDRLAEAEEPGRLKVFQSTGSRNGSVEPTMRRFGITYQCAIAPRRKEPAYGRCTEVCTPR
jgi:hypothetical protein